MKKHITRNDLYKLNLPIYRISLDSLHLLPKDALIGYNAGLNGWNYDAYLIDNKIIVSGYRMSLSDVIIIDYKNTKKFISDLLN